MGSICNMECLALAASSKVTSSPAARSSQDPALQCICSPPLGEQLVQSTQSLWLFFCFYFLKPRANIRCSLQQEGPVPFEINTCQLPTC